VTSNAADSHDKETEWMYGFADFLQEVEGVEAVLLDKKKKRISIATLGDVDEKALQRRLRETLDAINAHAEAAGELPTGMRLKRFPNDQTLLEKGQPCQTALRFWKWREIEWPEPTEQEEEETGEEWRFLATMAGLCGALGVTGLVLQLTGLGPSWLPVACYIGSMLFGGYDAAVDTVAKLRKREIDIHFLMLAVAVGATAIGHYGEGALLLFLFSFSGALEHFALHRTRREIDSLFAAAPKNATLVDEQGNERSCPVEQVKPNDRIVVRPGDLFPVDAVVLTGETAADESNLTGEATPVTKSKGDPVYSGTMNLWGAVEARVARPAAESSLQKIIRLIQQAQHLRAPSQRFTDRFGTPYTIGILSAVVVMFFVWWLVFGIAPFTNEPESYSAFYRAMTLLVVASPCALVLSIPSAILAAIAWGARHGILFRGGAAIEKLADIDVVALDKTGTLTTGELVVDRIESFPEGREQEVARMAFSLERNANHPIARAIVAYGRKQDLQPLPVEEFRNLLGKGVQGKFGESRCALGRRELLETGPLRDWAEKLAYPPAEYTEVWVIHGDLLGRVLLRDEIRRESKPVLERLRQEGIESVMLTGDRRETAEEVGRQLGLTEVRAGLSPEDKVNAVVELGQGDRRVAMVGDGVNDAPSLAAAWVAVAMGARGSDAALEQSEVVLMNDRIENFLEALRLSRSAKAIIRQNLVISLGTIALMVGASVMGIVPLTLGVFAHEGSTVLVCLNSLRLLFTKPAQG